MSVLVAENKNSGDICNIHALFPVNPFYTWRQFWMADSATNSENYRGLITECKCFKWLEKIEKTSFLMKILRIVTLKPSEQPLKYFGMTLFDKSAV